jgi:hypothetical protein
MLCGRGRYCRCYGGTWWFHFRIQAHRFESSKRLRSCYKSYKLLRPIYTYIYTRICHYKCKRLFRAYDFRTIANILRSSNFESEWEHIRNIYLLVRSEILMTVTMKINFLWNVTTCSLSYSSGEKIEAAYYSETSVNIYHATRSQIPEDNNLNFCP